MQIHPVRAAIAVAALASAALVGAAPLASAAPQTDASSCQITASLTGLAGKTLVAGGAPISGHVAFSNVSGKTLTTFAEIITAGPVTAGPNDALKIQGEHGGKWMTLHYMAKGVIGFHISTPGDNHLAVGNVDAAPLQISVPKGTPAGTYALAATSLGDNLGPAAPSHAAQDLPTQFNGCHGGISVSMQTFKVVAASQATATPTASATPSSTAAATPSSAASAPVATPSASASSTLAETGGGSDTAVLAGAAAALIAVGAGAVVFTRRRRAGQHS